MAETTLRLKVRSVTDLRPVRPGEEVPNYEIVVFARVGSEAKKCSAAGAGRQTLFDSEEWHFPVNVRSDAGRWLFLSVTRRAESQMSEQVGVAVVELRGLPLNEIVVLEEDLSEGEGKVQVEAQLATMQDGDDLGSVDGRSSIAAQRRSAFDVDDEEDAATAAEMPAPAPLTRSWDVDEDFGLLGGSSAAQPKAAPCGEASTSRIALLEDLEKRVRDRIEQLSAEAPRNSDEETQSIWKNLEQLKTLAEKLHDEVAQVKAHSLDVATEKRASEEVEGLCDALVDDSPTDLPPSPAARPLERSAFLPPTAQQASVVPDELNMGEQEPLPQESARPSSPILPPPSEVTLEKEDFDFSGFVAAANEILALANIPEGEATLTVTEMQAFEDEPRFQKFHHYMGWATSEDVWHLYDKDTTGTFEFKALLDSLVDFCVEFGIHCTTMSPFDLAGAKDQRRRWQNHLLRERMMQSRPSLPPQVPARPSMDVEEVWQPPKVLPPEPDNRSRGSLEDQEQKYTEAVRQQLAAAAAGRNREALEVALEAAGILGLQEECAQARAVLQELSQVASGEATQDPKQASSTAGQATFSFGHESAEAAPPRGVFPERHIWVAAPQGAENRSSISGRPSFGHSTDADDFDILQGARSERRRHSDELHNSVSASEAPPASRRDSSEATNVRSPTQQTDGDAWAASKGRPSESDFAHRIQATGPESLLRQMSEAAAEGDRKRASEYFWNPEGSRVNTLLGIDELERRAAQQAEQFETLAARAKRVDGGLALDPLLRTPERDAGFWSSQINAASPEEASIAMTQSPRRQLGPELSRAAVHKSSQSSNGSVNSPDSLSGNIGVSEPQQRPWPWPISAQADPTSGGAFRGGEAFSLQEDGNGSAKDLPRKWGMTGGVPGFGAGVLENADIAALKSELRSCEDRHKSLCSQIRSLREESEAGGERAATGCKGGTQRRGRGRRKARGVLAHRNLERKCEELQAALTRRRQYASELEAKIKECSGRPRERSERLEDGTIDAKEPAPSTEGRAWEIRATALTEEFKQQCDRVAALRNKEQELEAKLRQQARLDQGPVPELKTMAKELQAMLQRMLTARVEFGPGRECAVPQLQLGLLARAPTESLQELPSASGESGTNDFARLSCSSAADLALQGELDSLAASVAQEAALLQRLSMASQSSLTSVQQPRKDLDRQDSIQSEIWNIFDGTSRNRLGNLNPNRSPTAPDVGNFASASGSPGGSLASKIQASLSQAPLQDPMSNASSFPVLSQAPATAATAENENEVPQPEEAAAACKDSVRQSAMEADAASNRKPTASGDSDVQVMAASSANRMVDRMSEVSLIAAAEPEEALHASRQFVLPSAGPPQVLTPPGSCSKSLAAELRLSPKGGNLPSAEESLAEPPPRKAASAPVAGSPSKACLDVLAGQRSLQEVFQLPAPKSAGPPAECTEASDPLTCCSNAPSSPSQGMKPSAVRRVSPKAHSMVAALMSSNYQQSCSSRSPPKQAPRHTHGGQMCMQNALQSRSEVVRTTTIDTEAGRRQTPSIARPEGPAVSPSDDDRPPAWLVGSIAVGTIAMGSTSSCEPVEVGKVDNGQRASRTPSAPTLPFTPPQRCSQQAQLPEAARLDRCRPGSISLRPPEAADEPVAHPTRSPKKQVRAASLGPVAEQEQERFQQLQLELRQLAAQQAELQQQQKLLLEQQQQTQTAQLKESAPLAAFQPQVAQVRLALAPARRQQQLTTDLGPPLRSAAGAMRTASLSPTRDARFIGDTSGVLDSLPTLTPTCSPHSQASSSIRSVMPLALGPRLAAAQPSSSQATFQWAATPTGRAALSGSEGALPRNAVEATRVEAAQATAPNLVQGRRPALAAFASSTGATCQSFKVQGPQLALQALPPSISSRPTRDASCHAHLVAAVGSRETTPTQMDRQRQQHALPTRTVSPVGGGRSPVRQLPQVNHSPRRVSPIREPIVAPMQCNAPLLGSGSTLALTQTLPALPARATTPPRRQIGGLIRVYPEGSEAMTQPSSAVVAAPTPLSSCVGMGHQMRTISRAPSPPRQLSASAMRSAQSSMPGSPTARAPSPGVASSQGCAQDLSPFLSQWQSQWRSASFHT